MCFCLFAARYQDILCRPLWTFKHISYLMDTFTVMKPSLHMTEIVNIRFYFIKPESTDLSVTVVLN